MVMRGQIDLKGHKLAGLYRPPARKVKRTQMPKCPDAMYRQVWRLADGAVRDCLANHPEYLTQAGRNHARLSLVKRITGTFHGYATQVARGGSETPANVAGEDAANRTNSLLGGVVWIRSIVTVLRKACVQSASLWRRSQTRRPKF